MLKAFKNSQPKITRIGSQLFTIDLIYRTTKSIGYINLSTCTKISSTITKISSTIPLSTLTDLSTNKSVVGVDFN